MKKQNELVIRVAASASDVERVAIHNWALKLLEIRSSDLAAPKKAQAAISLTREVHVVWPVLKLLSGEVKRFAWKERSLAGKFGLSGAAVGMAVFGGHGAGIAALGTAIGVPLWVVLGSGAAFAGLLAEEFGRKRPQE